MAETKNTYDASSIQVLEGLQAVRKRPGMYIGGTGIAGLHHLIWEVVDNSIDEAMAGYCKNINVIIRADGSVSVEDDGRGIPVDKQKQTGKSALETVMTVLHAGGKFGGDGYKVSGGLHGVGVSVVNALSSYVRAEVRRDGKIYVQEFKDGGKPIGGLKTEGTTTKTGTTISFVPDPAVFEVIDFNWNTVLDRIRQQAYLTKGVKIKLTDERVGNSYGFYFEGGIKSYVDHLNRSKQSINEPIFYVEKSTDNVNVEIAVQYMDGFNDNVQTFANNIHTPEGGTHLTGFRTSLTRTLNDYARSHSLLKDNEGNLTGDDVREGLTAVISVKLPNPQFEGQTKAKLGNPEIANIVQSVFTQYFSYYLEQKPNEAKKIINK
jgi:DNA gyrase subunit B